MTRDEAINLLDNMLGMVQDNHGSDYDKAIHMAIDALKQPERKTGKWSTEQVAELLSNVFGDDCACNFNDIDEWLPESCKYVETTCPNPKEKNGCWMQFLLQGGADWMAEGEQP